MNKADKFVWAFVIEKGGVIEEWSYYGSSYSFDKKETEKVKKDIIDIGIDWTKTKTITDSYESGFNGTFAESNLQIKTMTGTLVLKNGHRYNFGISDVNFSDIIAFMVDYIELNKERE